MGGHRVPSADGSIIFWEISKYLHTQIYILVHLNIVLKLVVHSDLVILILCSVQYFVQISILIKKACFQFWYIVRSEQWVICILESDIMMTLIRLI